MRNSEKQGTGTLLEWIYRLCQSRSSKTKRSISRYPASVLAPESALGSLPSVALSSAQADLILCESEKHACFINNQRSTNPRPVSLEMAGFELAINGRFWGGHRGSSSSAAAFEAMFSVVVAFIVVDLMVVSLSSFHFRLALLLNRCSAKALGVPLSDAAGVLGTSMGT